MPKEHYATRLKRENRELKAEVERLRDAAPQPSTVPDFSELKAAIQDDVEIVSADDIGQLLLNEVCIRLNCRENTFIMEEGRSIKAQPFRLTDSRYKLVSSAMLKRILAETQIDAIQWQQGDYDCEDIARKFVTRCVDLGINSVGRVMSWSGKHAFCIAITQEDVVFLEPQTDEIVREMTGQYDLSNALIVIA